MQKKTLATFVTLIILLVSLFGTAGAQSGSTPEATPTAAAPTADAATQPGSKFFTHPIVQLLSAYFDQETAEDPTVTAPPDPNAIPDPNATPDPAATADPNTSGLGPIGEEIAALHEQGMGFGVLVKIFAMVKASDEACAAQATDPTTPVEGTGTGDDTTTPTCTPLSADQLVKEFQSGAGMGALFKEYGKPALLGVGHVKKELKKHAASGDETSVEATPEATVEGQAAPDDHNGNSQGNGKGQGKDNGKGNGNGKGMPTKEPKN